MVCGSCGRQNREGARFCDACAAPLAPHCGQCAAELRPDAIFCDACAAPVGESAVPPEARKIVTVVFADLIGSTPLQERMDAESVRHVMGRFYEAMSGVLEEHGGRVAKFIGDAVMAVFGAPFVREDDAERAVRAAFAMVAILPSLNEEIEQAWGVRIGMRTGVNTGEIVESSEGFVVGDPVNVAARLEQAASDGEVLIGEETWRLVRDKLTLERVADLDLKGKAEPVPAYRLVSLDPPPAESSAPFVGRDDELAKLADAFERAIADNCARLATVIGSPGVGKTRLAGELTSSAGSRALVLEARCEPAGTSTFAPIADALREAAAIDEAAPDDAVTAALLALLPPSQSDRERIASRAASVLGAGDPGPPEETFWAVRRIFEALARELPLVLVLDDVHWAEPMLLDLIEHLADWTRDAPMLLLALARPELRETRPSLTQAGAREALIVLLEGLDAESSVKLAEDLLGADQLPAALTERILASSEGNPLFLRELVRMLVDDGVLRKDDGSWVVTVDATEIDVPPTIQALLSARIDRLPADERVVVERASVIGKHFYRGAVAALSPAPVAHALDGHLETLRRKELVEPEGTYWIDEPVFRFHHVLIRDAAYRRLLKETRAELHERFAEWLERKAGDLVGEHEEIIGYHLEQAHEYRRQLGPLDEQDRELGRRAAEHLAAAGRRAIERDDLAAAAPLLGRALGRLEAPDPEILIDRCEALLDLGDVAAGGPCVEELTRAAGTPRLAAWADCFVGQLANLVDPAHLRDTAERVAAAAERFEEIGDAAGAAKAHHVHAQTLGRLGQIGASEAALDRALAAAREAGDNRRSNSVLAGAPVAALWGPSPVTKASGRCLDVVRVLRITTGSAAVEATALRCQAVLEALRGRADAARKMLDASRSTLEELGLRHELAENDVFAGRVEQLSDNAPAAEAKLRSAYDELRRLGVDADAAYAAALLARSLLSLGRDQEAEELTHESERLGGDDLKTAIAWRAVRGAAIARRGEVDESLRLAREAVALAEGTDALIDHADARRALGLALREAGRDAEAEAEVARAIELYESKGATAAAERARTAGERAEVSSPEGTRVGFARVAPGVDTAHLAYVERLRVAVIEHDWEDSFASAFHSDFVMTDVRAGLRSEVVGRDAWVQGIGETYDGRQVDIQMEIVASRNRVVMVRMFFFGSGDAVSGPWESDRLTVMALHAVDDVLVRGHYLDPDDHDAAVALFEEWAGAVVGVRAAPEVPARFTTYWERFRSAASAKDWEMFGSLFHPHVVYADHRTGLRSEVVGRDEMVRVVRESYGTRELDADVEILASRGDAALHATRWFGPGDALGGPWEAERISVSVLDEHDLLVRVDLFDPDDRVRPFALLREYSLTPGGVGAARSVDPRHQVCWGHIRTAFATKDWALLGSLWHADIVHTDRRAGLQSEVVGRDEYIRITRESFGAREMDYDVEIMATRGNAGVSHNRWSGPGDELGGPFEADRLVFYVLDDHERFVRFVLFDPDDHEAAFALLREHAGGGVRAAPGIDARHTTWWQRAWSAMVAKDWDTFGSGLHRDVLYADRRPGLRSEVVGRDEMVRVIRESYGTREVDYEVEILATRGNAGVTHGRFFGPGDDLGGPWETERLNCYVLEGELLAHMELFDPNDRDEVLARLEELDRTDSPVSSLVGRFIEAYNARDWPTLEALMAPDFVLDDRRPLGWGRSTGFDPFFTRIRIGIDAAPDARITIASWLRHSDDAGLFDMPMRGHIASGGGDFELDRLMLAVVEGDRIVRLESFDPDQESLALERFHQLTATD